MHHHRSAPARPHARLLSALALGLALALTACGSDEPTDTDATSQNDTAQESDHNDADVSFATDMVQHHAQALTMVELTDGRTLDPQVQQLADEIRDAQAPEIETMSGWLEAWDEEVPDTSGGHDMSGHAMDDMSDMPGMMSAEDLDMLADASDADFQTMWLQMMVEHHEGAVEMAEAEQAEGAFAPAIELAGTIIKSQTAEIDQMRTLLGS